jgi:predicted small lipoprotein YifL
MNYYISKLLPAIAFVILTGCGQTGPLYMPPEETPPVPPAAAEPEPASSEDSSKEPRKEP